jgi:hypothetical protein
MWGWGRGLNKIPLAITNWQRVLKTTFAGSYLAFHFSIEYICITLPHVHDATANIPSNPIACVAKDAHPSLSIEIEAACSAHVPR